jgi:hypothetical protein
MDDFNIVFKRLYEVLGIQKDIEFSRLAGVSANTVSAWRAKKHVPYNIISQLAKTENFSIDYVVLGIQKNSSFTTSSILDDFTLALGDEAKAKEYLNQKLLEVVIAELQKNNLGFYATLERIFSFASGAVKGFEARPLLFLYYILHTVEKNDEAKSHPKKALIQAIENTHFSRWVFGVEFLSSSVQKISQYIEFVMSDKDAELIVRDVSTILSVLKNMMPVEMVVAHQKRLEKA